MAQYRKIFRIFLLLFTLYILGVAGYMVIEGWDFLDSLYMTVISLTTTGYRETHPLTPKGRVFTLILLTLGVSFFVYAVGILTEAAVEGHFGGLLKKRKMENAIKKISQHFIICGFGRIGKIIAESIHKAGIPLVIVENNPNLISEIEKGGYLYVEGDATQDEVLKSAGVDRARGAISVLGSDADNVYTTLTARAMNPGLLIVARASDKKAEKRIMQAGADKVISPYEIGAKRMAHAILKPTVIEFLDLAVHSLDFNLFIEQVNISEGSFLDGKSIQEVDLRKITGVTILAVQKPTERMISSPSPECVLSGGDIAIVLGDNKGLSKFKEIAQRKAS